ncbi:MAG: hypothetical protein SNJ53_00190 [Thermodesulfovibrionales bacterium]
MKYIAFVIFFVSIFPVCSFAETIRVITKENFLRENCRFFATIKANLKYGDALEVISPEGDWYRARFRNITGCIHKSAVDQRVISPTASGFGSTRQTATEHEVALAGKGFTPEVESAFKKKNPDMKYNLVDAIERYKTDEKRVFEFIKMGGLTQP